jgi:hypothetical protein
MIEEGEGTGGDLSDGDEQRAPGEEHADGASGGKEAAESSWG